MWLTRGCKFMKVEISERITKIREELNMTKEAFAKELHITPQYLGQVEKGKCMLSLEKLKLLCEYTNTSSDYILFGKDTNLIYNTKIKLHKLTDKQIKHGCNMLKELALFLNKDNVQ
jgi:transcriptional regulator with XRE-family HTH domain